MKFFNLIQQWNYNDLLDKNNNICLSFIIENEKEYSTYLYPNFKRETVEKFFSFIKNITFRKIWERAARINC